MRTEIVAGEHEGASREIAVPLTDAQKQLWLLAQRDDNASRAYNVPVVLGLRGSLSAEEMHQAIEDVVDRHGALRTTISSDGHEQKIPSSMAVDVPLVDLSGLEAKERSNRLTNLLESTSNELFDLARGPLFRASIVKLEQEQHLLMLVAHHIIVDGWSMGVLVKDIAVAYTARCQGQHPPQEPPLQFGQYANWLNEHLSDAYMQDHESYWLDHLVGPVPQLELPTDRPRPPLLTFCGARQSITMDSELVQRLNLVSKQNNCTPFMTLLAGYMVLLHRLSGQDELLVGVPVTKRALKGGGELVGYCVNMLPILGRLSAGMTFQEYLVELRATLLGAYAHAAYPFASLVNKLDLPRDPSRPPLVGTTFNMNAPLTASVTMPDLEIELVQPPIGYTQHELSLNIIGINDEFFLEFEYNTNLFDTSSAERFAQRLMALYEEVAVEPEQRVASLDILTGAERRQLLVEWNATETDYPRELCLHQLFETQFEKTPEATAVVFEDQSLTYAELNARANQLAHYLRTLGVGPDVLVGICVERSLELVVGLLGILKAGGAYVPLDPDYPTERLAFMLAETATPVVLTHERVRARVPSSEAQVLALDTDCETIAAAPADTPGCAIASEHLAYVIYTSGSTGQPKGVGVSHAAIVNRLQWMQAEYGLDATDRVLQKTPFSFDVSVWEFFWPLMTGAQLVVAKPDGHKDSAYLAELIAQQAITTLHFVPPMLAVFLEEAGIAACRALRRVICSGEALPFELMQRHFERLDVPLHNLYGPTEAAVDVSYWACDPETALSSVPIGRPVANTQLYILDAEFNPVPVGVAGELYIGGVQLARGYVDRPDLTAERFLPHPFSTTPGARLYKTGDLARYRPDGNIEFRGRLDHQVKVRGFRIELGEIEALLSQHPAVREAVVVVRHDVPGDGRLVAYVVATDAEPAVSALHVHLKDKLPEYMVPTAFVFLEALPLTPNGKVDRKALPAPDQQPGRVQDYVAPRTPNEKRLAEIWAEVLGIEQVGIHDNFFELGGESILGIQVISRANQAGLKLAPQQLFEHPTVAGLAAVAGVAKTIQAEQGLVTGSIPLTPIQRWFFEADLPVPQHFNQSVLLEVLEPLEPKLLESAIKHLLEHHDALRMRFEHAASGWQQVNRECETQEVFSQFDLCSQPSSQKVATLEGTAARLQASLDIENGPLMQAAMFEMGPDQPDRLLLIIHHLVVDGVSWRILLDDLHTVYRQLKAGQAMVLSPKTTSFKQWAERMQAYAQSDQMCAELDYWLGAEKSAQSLPLDTPSGANSFASARTITASLTQEETQALLQEAPEAYNTQINDLLLTALAQTLYKWSGTPAVRVDLEGHGREPLFDDLDLTRTVGWFTTLYPVQLDLNDTAGQGEAIKAIKETLREVPRKGIGFGMLRYLTDHTVRAKLDAIPRPQIRFNYLGQFDQALRDGPFRLAQEDRGAEHSESEPGCYLFDLNGSVTNNQLSISWTYSEQQYRRETVERLAHGFIAVLRALIEHCVAPEAGGYTPSDFEDVDLSQSDLEELLVEYETTGKER